MSETLTQKYERILKAWKRAHDEAEKLRKQWEEAADEVRRENARRDGNGE